MAEEKQIKINIEIDDVTAQGIYSNMAFIAHSQPEFLIDFLFIQPTQGKGRVRSRVILSPPHAKRLLAALDENIKKYEKNFGPISEPKAQNIEMNPN